MWRVNQKVSGSFRNSSLFHSLYLNHKTLLWCLLALWSVKLWSPWTLAPSPEWTRSRAHWPGSGQRYLDKYKCRGIFDSVPVSVVKLAVRPGAEAQWKAAGLTLNLRRRLSSGVCRPQRRILSLSFGGRRARSKDIIKAILTFFSSWHSTLFFFVVLVGGRREGVGEGL